MNFSVGQTEIKTLKTDLLSIENKVVNLNRNLANLLNKYDSLSDDINKSKPEPIYHEEVSVETKNSNQNSTSGKTITEKPKDPKLFEVQHSKDDAIIDSLYNLSTSYSLSFPVDTDFREYQMEYDWGHHLEGKLYRNWDSFFVGLSIGFKTFENHQLRMPYTVGSMVLPAEGSNLSVFTSLSIGTEHFLNNSTFITGSAGLGFGKAWDEIKVGGVHIFDDSDYFLYGMLQLGIGYVFNESYSLLAFYQFDAQGSRNHFETQYFNQIGLGLGIHY